MTPSCETCRFWPINCWGGGNGGYHADGAYSQCRRRAPIFTGDAKRDCYFAGNGTAWPYTAKADWCGEWEARDSDTLPKGEDENLASRDSESSAGPKDIAQTPSVWTDPEARQQGD
jgi:hypothetical protein